MRRIGWLAVIAVVLAGCGGATHTITVGKQRFAPKAGESATVRVGQSIAVLTADGGTAIVTVLSVVYHAKGVGPAAEPPENGIFAVADIAVQVHSGHLIYGAPYFHYQAANGTVYSWTDGHGVTAGFEPAMQFGTLSAGQSTRGLICFDVPPGQGMDIQLQGVGGAVIGEWRLD